MGSTSIERVGRLAFVLLALSFAGPAGAVPSVDLYFVGLNGAPIGDATNLAVAPGDLLDVEMRMTTDERGTSAYSISVDFDSAGLGRLVPVDFSIILPPALDFTLGVGAPWGPDDPSGMPGFIRVFSGATFDRNPDTRNQTFAIGKMSFEVTANILDGPARIAPGFFPTSVDEILSNEIELIGGSFTFADLSAEYAMQGVTLTVIPEPSSALLLGSALIASAQWRRHRRQGAPR